MSGNVWTEPVYVFGIRDSEPLAPRFSIRAHDEARAARVARALGHRDIELIEVEPDDPQARPRARRRVERSPILGPPWLPALSVIALGLGRVFDGRPFILTLSHQSRTGRPDEPTVQCILEYDGSLRAEIVGTHPEMTAPDQALRMLGWDFDAPDQYPGILVPAFREYAPGWQRHEVVSDILVVLASLYRVDIDTLMTFQPDVTPAVVSDGRLLSVDGVPNTFRLRNVSDPPPRIDGYARFRAELAARRRAQGDPAADERPLGSRPLTPESTFVRAIWDWDDTGEEWFPVTEHWLALARTEQRKTARKALRHALARAGIDPSHLPPHPSGKLYGDGSSNARGTAIRALYGRHLISPDGFTQSHYSTLTELWSSHFALAHPSDPEPALVQWPSRREFGPATRNIKLVARTAMLMDADRWGLLTEKVSSLDDDLLVRAEETAWAAAVADGLVEQWDALDELALTLPQGVGGGPGDELWDEVNRAVLDAMRSLLVGARVTSGITKALQRGWRSVDRGELTDGMREGWSSL